MHDAHDAAGGSLRPADRQATGTAPHHDTAGVQHTLSGHGRGDLWTRDTWLAGNLHAAGRAQQNSGSLHDGGQRESGRGDSNGRAFGTDSCSLSHAGPDFALKVPDNGYAWWYVDGISDDGQHGITLIAFVGSVFSPYYKSARRKGLTDPENHCALNVALYSRGAARWAMTERSKPTLTRSRDIFAIGPSAIRYDGTDFIIDIDEKAFPLIASVRGQIRISPSLMPARAFALDDAGRHIWQPIAPMGRIDVTMQAPALSWRGHAYVDHNRGLEPIEDGFAAWEWSRSEGKSRSLILFDTQPRAGAARHMALSFHQDGGIESFNAPPRQPMRRGLWMMARHTRSENEPQLLRTLEDAPFYTRNMIRSKLDGEDMTGVHESLSLDRFNSPVVQHMLPFRMPRAGASRAFF
jgi:carotenoid 1,2-hydratase